MHRRNEKTKTVRAKQDVRLSAPKRRARSVRYASAFIATANVPKELGKIPEKWLGTKDRPPATPVDIVLEAAADKGISYSVPARARKGDIIFFHYAARAIAYTRSLQREAMQDVSTSARLQEWLDWAKLVADGWAGGIYAYGTLESDPYLEGPDPGPEPHWRNKLYAEVGQIVELKETLYIDEHADAIPQPISGITPLSRTQFAELKVRLKALGNRLHPTLEDTEPGRTDLQGISEANWRENSCGSDVQFGCEADLRGYLVDFLLKDLGDPRTDVFSEVRCLRKKRGGRQTGLSRADYVLCVGGKWLPVEVKLTLANWPDIVDQVRAYVTADFYQFIDAPDAEPRRAPVSVENAWRSCLVVDRDGLYLIGPDGFIASEPGDPLRKRRDLAGNTDGSLRVKLLSILQSAATS